MSSWGAWVLSAGLSIGLSPTWHPYAWGSLASKSHAAKLPDMVILTLLYLRENLGELDFKVGPYRVAPCSEPLFAGTLPFRSTGQVALGLSISRTSWDARRALGL